MELFVFSNPVSPTKMEQGVFINNIKSIMWIERYRDAGEFKLIASVDSGIRKILPIGSFISHMNTPEVMIVENHEISDDQDKDSEVTITGRGFETYLDNRIVGSNRTFPVSAAVTDYVMAAEIPSTQAAALLTNHITTASLLNDDDAIPFVSVYNYILSSLALAVARSLKRGGLYTRLLEVLAIDNLGVKIFRPGPWSPIGAASPNLVIAIHKGQDLTSNVIFSYDAGEIISSDYLWSNKNLKNGAYITGKWVETVVLPTAKEYARRMMYIDAHDIDDSQTVAPTGGTLTFITTVMQQRGNEALAAQNNIALTKAEVSRDRVKYRYRTDYNVGDLVRVSGDYNEISTMRVTEFVEIEDETGESGYPTLTIEET